MGTEIQIGSVVDGKTVVDIVYTVHLANKKANFYVLDPNLPDDELTIQGYRNGCHLDRRRFDSFLAKKTEDCGVEMRTDRGSSILNGSAQLVIP